MRSAIVTLVERDYVNGVRVLMTIIATGERREMMNKKFILIVMSFVFLSGVNASASDIDKGFFKYAWGDSISKYSELSKLGDKGDVSYYSKPGETYMVGNVLIDKAIYGFYKDQLFGVYLNIDSMEVYDKLLRHMKSQYGLPAYETTSNHLVTYEWKHQDVTIKLKINESTRKMKLAFYFQPFSRKLNAKQWEEPDTSSFHFVPIEKGKKPEKFVLFTF
jgi:hypothetical protein